MGLGRTNDILGAGLSRLAFSPQISDRRAETAIEVFYKARIKPWIVVHPVFQFIASPDGLCRDAFVVGLRFEMVL